MEHPVASGDQGREETGSGGTITAVHGHRADGRALRTPFDRPRRRRTGDLVTQRGQAFGEARSVVGVERPPQRRGPARRRRQEQRAVSDGLRPGNLGNRHASRA
jgi:hypothetical protein